MFAPRTSGLTLRRVQDALIRPHDPVERRDPDFPIVIRCDKCGKHGQGPRSQIQEAIREHNETCPGRHKALELVTRLFYPRI